MRHPHHSYTRAIECVNVVCVLFLFSLNIFSLCSNGFVLMLVFLFFFFFFPILHCGKSNFCCPPCCNDNSVYLYGTRDVDYPLARTQSRCLLNRFPVQRCDEIGNFPSSSRTFAKTGSADRTHLLISQWPVDHKDSDLSLILHLLLQTACPSWSCCSQRCC